jgi:hypothetical protein
MKKYLLLFVVLVTYVNCNDDDCGYYNIGPPITSVEFVRNATDENIFTSGEYDYTDIDVVKEDGEPVTAYFIDENEYNIIRFIPYTYEESNTVFIKIGDEINAKITFDINKVSTDCYTNYFIQNLKVENYPYEISTTNGLVTIKV